AGGCAHSSMATRRPTTSRPTASTSPTAAHACTSPASKRCPMHSSEGIVARPAPSVAPPHRAHEAPTARQAFARTPSQTRPMRGRRTSLPIYTRRVLAVTAFSFGLHPQALQVVEASDGVAVEAIVSLREPTRIRIEGMPVTDVFGNIHSSHCGSAGPLPAAIPGTTATAGGAGTTAPAGPINPAGDVVV